MGRNKQKSSEFFESFAHFFLQMVFVHNPSLQSNCFDSIDRQHDYVVDKYILFGFGMKNFVHAFVFGLMSYLRLCGLCEIRTNTCEHSCFPTATHHNCLLLRQCRIRMIVFMRIIKYASKIYNFFLAIQTSKFRHIYHTVLNYTRHVDSLHLLLLW